MAMQMGQVNRRWPRIWLWLSPTQREWNQSPQPSHAIMVCIAVAAWNVCWHRQ
jgi:hypothetical protein